MPLGCPTTEPAAAHHHGQEPHWVKADEASAKEGLTLMGGANLVPHCQVGQTLPWKPTETKNNTGKIPTEAPKAPYHHKEAVAFLLNTDFIFGNRKREGKETYRDLNLALNEYST